MSTRLTIWAAAISVALVPHVALAQEPASFGPDANGDGLTTWEEAKDHGSRIFERMDVDRNGKIDRSDWAEPRRLGEMSRSEPALRGERRRIVRFIRRADSNRDRVLTRAEFDVAFENRFQRMDSDNSGSISVDERSAVLPR
jgi:hypothetical protein